MRILYSRTRDPAVGAEFASHVLRGLAVLDLALIRERGLPSLYDSGVRYIRDPKGKDYFADVVHILRAGGADCSSLVAWRIADLWNAGETSADFRLHWRSYPDGLRQYHILVRRADGMTEDPSRMLGMPTE